MPTAVPHNTAMRTSTSTSAVPLIGHVITTLGIGGAEMMLYKLLAASDRSRFDHAVVALGPEDAIAPRIRALGIEVVCLNLSRSGANAAGGLIDLVRWMRKRRPTIVQTWMHHADLIGGIAARLAGIRKIAWGIRSGDLNPAVTRRRTVWIARVCGILSRFVPQVTVCCSEASRRSHAELNYDQASMVVIPNGFDLQRFSPSADVRASMRAQLGIPGDAIAIGSFARFHPAKDHATFFRAAGLLGRAVPNTVFLLCGEGIESADPQLSSWISQAGLQGRCYLLGRRNDVPALTAALDIATSSSCGTEAFSNAIGEAMATAVPCVVTDVGDSASIVGDAGLVVPPRSPERLCAAWRELIDLGTEGRSRLGLDARHRVRELFSLEQAAIRYQNLYEHMAIGGSSIS